MLVSSAAPAVSVVSPVYGCKGCLEELADRVASQFATSSADFELILVDDGSPDGAWAQIVALSSTRAWLRGFKLARNFGQHYAIAAGIEQARGEIVVVMDCDLQDVPEEIPGLLNALRDNPNVAVVFGQRVDRADGALKRFTSWAFFKVLSWLTGVRQDHTTANFGAYRRKVIDVINSMPERDRCFPLMVKWAGFPSTSIPVQHAARSQGRSGYSLRKLLSLALGIVLSYSDKPLRLVVRLGLGFSAVAITMALASVYRYFQGDIQVAGFTSIIASVWLLGGVSIFCLGVVGLYVGRQFNDAKGRPYYIIDQSTNTNYDQSERYVTKSIERKET